LQAHPGWAGQGCARTSLETKTPLLQAPPVDGAQGPPIRKEQGMQGIKGDCLICSKTEAEQSRGNGSRRNGHQAGRSCVLWSIPDTTPVR
jgi:hypothetical protein